MAFPDDLLEQAYELAKKEPVNPKQASLRRAISTAYYAVFHLLIDQAVGNWAVKRQRSRLARTFEHGQMRYVCEKLLERVRSGAAVPEELHLIADCFVRLQQQRRTADYDNSTEWSRSEVLLVLGLASDAFDAWRVVRDRDEAQDFLLQLFLPKRPAQ